MDYKKIMADSVIAVFSGVIASLFFGLPLIVYYGFYELFEYFGNPPELCFQLAIAALVVLLLIITLITFVVKIVKQNSLIFHEKEATFDAYYKSSINSIKEKEGDIEAEKHKVLQFKADSEKILKEKAQTYPWLAKLYADFNYIFDDNIVKALRYKSRPAVKAAQQVAAIAKEKRELTRLCKMYEYQLNFYESIFPWLEEFKEVEPMDAWKYVRETDLDGTDEYDRVKNWLSPEDYNNLPSVQKWQLALDRYNRKKKSNWEIGIDYERYVGYLHETKGYKVRYQGALLGLEDMGRDVIANKDNETLVIQCKRWAKEKTIHEKHIFQLYGSVVVLRTQNPKKEIKGIFVTTTHLSDVARKCADYLKIEVIEEFPYKPYPMIKCNNTQNGKIYHLPFDQQYDRLHIGVKDGDRYVATVSEAEQLGFRHAYRWRGTDSN